MTTIRTWTLVGPAMLLACSFAFAAGSFAPPVALADHTSSRVQSAKGPVSGTWSLDSRRSSETRFEMRYEPRPGTRWTSQSTGTIEAIHGLEADPVRGRDGTVRFRIVRDAGTVRFEGRAKAGRGSGTFRFEGNADYRAALERAGYEVDDDEELFKLWDQNIGLEMARAFATPGSRPAIATLQRLGAHGVTPNFIRELRALGYGNLSAEDLVRLRSHGVTPEYVRHLKELGYGSLSVEDMVRMRAHGID